MEALLDHGEGLLVPERMIVAPTVGTFRPVELGAGSHVTCGQTVGVLEGPGTETPVESPFAGRIGLYMEGYYSSEVNQRENAAALERDHPSVAISEPSRERTDLATHPSALEFLARHYRPLGELTATDGTVFRVLGRIDRQATSTSADVGWPCYR